MTVAWFSQFPVEWLPDAPDWVKRLPREHASSWQRVLLEELENVHSLRVHVIVLRKQFPHDSSFERNGVTFHLLKTPGGLRAPSLFWVDTLLIRRKLAELKPQVVHAWGTERGAALVAARLKYPSVVTMQGLLTWINEVVRLPWYQRFAARLERMSLSRAPLVTVESTFAAKYLKSHFACPEVCQVEHAPAWVFHRVRRQPQIKPVRFIFVGTLSRIKGVDTLLMALDELKGELPFELLLVTEPNQGFLEFVKRRTSTALWQCVQIKHNVAPSEVADELSKATMMLFASRADNSPNAVKEAVVAGVPVVSSAVGGVLDYVIPGQNGLLFRAGDAGGLVEAIRNACHHRLFSQGLVDPAVLSRMRDYLSPALMGKRFQEIYEHARSRHP